MSISDTESIFADTTHACYRNAISDVTFRDSLNITTRLVKDNSDQFPFTFIEKNIIHRKEEQVILEKKLKDGREMPSAQFSEDWIIIVLVAATLIYGVIRVISKYSAQGITRFFLFRNIGDTVSRDTGGLFHWETTLINLVSFVNIALFAWCVSVYYDVNPPGISGIILWLILLGVIIVAVTIRHIVCFITGNASGEKAAFDEYLLTVYHGYWYMALFMFILVILISYTSIFAVKTLIISGIIVAAYVYIVRFISLFLIFINRNISILYLILYLCALEFLPVVISVKYFTGLF